MSIDLKTELGGLLGVRTWKSAGAGGGSWPRGWMCAGQPAFWMVRGARLITITAVAGVDGETTLIYHYSLGAQGDQYQDPDAAHAIASIVPATAAADLD